MNIPKVLASAAKIKATEVMVEAGEPTQIILHGEVRTLFASTVSAADFDAGIVKRLGAFAREQLRTTGRCQWQFEEKGIGKIQADVEPNKTRFLMPPPSEGATAASGSKSDVPAQSNHGGLFGKLFGGK
jgi:Tfp pilus assembly pilus retraction ATPase PilT